MDKNAFKEILRTHRDRVFSYCVYCLRNRDDAEDVTQDAFVRLWRNRGEVDPARIEGWLIRVAHNLCIDQTRRRKTARHYLGQPEMRMAAEQAASAALAAGPDQGLAREQTRTLLLDAMSTLKDETRSAVVMHYFQGMKIEEIAQVLEKKTSTVKVQIHRARKVLRGVIEMGQEYGAVLKRETT
jgi:RNA polymerase sigma-70 factor, ECF subfamily